MLALELEILLMAEPLLRTTLYEWHRSHGARLVPFAGWEMPVQYESIVAEHQATRTAIGLFDISHMGRLTFEGRDAIALLDLILTRHVAAMRPGQVRYSLVLNERGGTKDDVLIYRAAEPAGPHLLVVNAANRTKIIEWIAAQKPAQLDCTVTDRTLQWPMIAVQGPKSVELVKELTGWPVDELRYYRYRRFERAGRPAFVSRTGYTGEDGVEVVAEPELVVPLWNELVQRGGERGLRPCGLGARDTLRLEAAMPLYGHELDEETNPIEAGLAFAVSKDKDDYIGKQAIEAVLRTGPRRKRIGLELPGRRIAREGYGLYNLEGQQIGQVTSGTFGPTLQKSIAMGYVPPECAEPGGKLAVDLRGNKIEATVVELPFYKRAK